MSQLLLDRPTVFLDVIIGDHVVGRLFVRLYSDVAPRTCEVLRDLCATGKLTGSVVRRIVPGFLMEITPPPSAGDALWHLDETPVAVSRPPRHRAWTLSIGRRGPLPQQIGPSLIFTFASAHNLDGHHLIVGYAPDSESRAVVLDKVERVGSVPLGVCSQSVRVGDCGEVLDDDDDDGPRASASQPAQ